MVIWTVYVELNVVIFRFIMYIITSLIRYVFFSEAFSSVLSDPLEKENVAINNEDKKKGERNGG